MAGEELAALLEVHERLGKLTLMAAPASAALAMLFMLGNPHSPQHIPSAPWSSHNTKQQATTRLINSSGHALMVVVVGHTL